jgi:hypothetical protein
MPEKAALIAVLLVGKPSCMTCLAEKAAISPGAVQAYLDRMRAVVQLREQQAGQCERCHNTNTLVYSLVPID